MKKLGFILVTLGVLTILFSVFADALGSGQDRGFGAAQFLGLQLGALLILTGTGFVIIKPEGGYQIRERAKAVRENILNWPVIVWLLIPFFVEFILFFILPMFFSRARVHYFTRYIPDAYITHIGFDIEATVSRIGAWLATGQSPYADGFLLYTPFVFALFAPLVMLGYPAYYRFIVLVTLLSYCATFVISALLVPRKRLSLLALFLVLGLFSYGFQFELERGQFNLIAFAASLLAIYIFHAHPKYRYFAYLLFTLAIQLKLYPAIFIFLFVEDWRDWRGILKRFLGLGLLNFALLFVLGFDFFRIFLARAGGFQLHYQSSRLEDLSMTGFVYNLTTDGFGLFGPQALARLAQYAGLIRAGFLLLFGLALFSVIAYAYAQKQAGFNPYLLFVCTIGAMIIPSQSADYKLSILVAPLAVVLCTLPELFEPRKKLVQAGLVFLAAAAYWSTFYPAKVKPYLIARNFPALIVLLVTVTILHLILHGKFISRSGSESKVKTELELDGSENEIGSYQP